MRELGLGQLAHAAEETHTQVLRRDLRQKLAVLRPVLRTDGPQHQPATAVLNALFELTRVRPEREPCGGVHGAHGNDAGSDLRTHSS
jgi:hypothetical protein